MSHDFSRTRRVGEQIRRELADLIRIKVKEPNLGVLSILDVRVSADLSQARVYVSILQDDPQVIRYTMSVLHVYGGRLRSHLGRRMRIRTVPRFEFIYDDLIERGAGLGATIDNAVRQDHLKAAQYGTGTEDSER